MPRRQADQYSNLKSTSMEAVDRNAEDYELREALLATEEQDRSTKPRGQEDLLPAEGRTGDVLAMNLALFGAAFFTIVTWVIVLVNNPVANNWGWFAFHPPLQSLSLALLIYGILTLQPTSQPKTKAAGLVRHQYAILLMAFPIMFLGTFAVMLNKYLHGAVHFKTWHAKFGILCMGWMFVQVVLGGGSVWFGGAAFGGGYKAKAVWKYHRLSGYVLFALLMFTAHIGGAWSNWGMKYSPWILRVLAYGVSLAACAAGVYIRLRPSKMKFF